MSALSVPQGVCATVPDGAALDPATGAFTWRPGPGTAGQHFTVTFSAADDGDPALSDTKTLDVDVLNRILVAVPDVTGQTTAAAEGLLDAVDLVISTTTEQCSGTVPAGLVISQFPEAGAQLYTGNAVALVVSRGVCVHVPDVVGLAQADESATVAGDRGALRVLLANLIGNALRYAPEGGRVDVSCGIHDSAAWLEVADNGPGIPAEERERVFDRFYRHGGGSGAGLGLSIVRTIARRHGAMVRLLDSEGGGLSARVEFPAEGGDTV